MATGMLIIGRSADLSSAKTDSVPMEVFLSGRRNMINYHSYSNFNLSMGSAVDKVTLSRFYRKSILQMHMSPSITVEVVITPDSKPTDLHEVSTLLSYGVGGKRINARFCVKRPDNMLSKVREPVSDHEQEQFEKWLRGEIVPDQDLQHIAHLMRPTMGLKKAPNIHVLKKMSEYKQVMGPSASVFHAPAFFIMQDELETDEQKAKRSSRAYVEGDFGEETDIDEGLAKCLERGKKREAHGPYVWPEYGHKDGPTESEIKKVQDLINRLKLMLQPPPAEFVPDPEYAHIKLGRHEPDVSGGGSQAKEEEPPEDQQEADGQKENRST
ncbi:hypothetical protein E8E11_002258 [Didymella keratinophila]|nr:hypothetical protein E8E11_002258 [Didymella keratinophila]